MSWKSSLFYSELPEGGEVHLYEDLSPEVWNGENPRPVFLNIWAPDFGDRTFRVVAEKECKNEPHSP